MDIDETAERHGRDDSQPAWSTAGDPELSGLIRRVRRMAKLSQRELAHELGVSQSAVAKWETGRTAPSARMLTRILDVASLSLVAVKDNGELVRPMRTVAARDAAHRRYPAHAFVWAEGWWAPEGAGTTAWLNQILSRSADLELPRVRYSRAWQPARPPTIADLLDHPTWPELVAEAKEGWQPRRRRPTPIPEWALEDTKKSRNRRPGKHRTALRWGAD
jgi:transcriptional regulator with XRE-family HTH domain